MTADERHDVIVIGGGIGGLSCAAFLARRGMDVLVAEQAPTPGGCCSAFRADGFTFDAAVHHVSGGGPRSLVGRALAEVGAPVDFVRLDPMDTLVWPDMRFEVPGRWEALLAALVRRFPRHAAAVEEAFAELVRLYRAVLGSPGSRRVFERWADRTFLDFLTAFIDDERLIRVLSGQWGYLGASPQRLAATGMCQMLVNYWRDGAHYPRGGTQAIPDALVAAVRSAGGVVRLARGVRRIIVEGQDAVGVELAGGGLVWARWIVSNIDVPQLVHRLVGGAVPAAYAERVDRLEVSTPFFLLYLGIGSGFPLARLPRGFYHLDRRLGGPWLYVSSPSETDPTLAPPGRHAVTVVVSLDEREVDIASWAGARDARVRETIGLLDSFAPGFGRQVETARSAHPPVPARRTSNFCGAPYGWAVTPDQSGPRRLASETPIRNLHLAGHWTTPGPGVCAVIASGWRTANHILRSAATAVRGAVEPSRATEVI
jgi:phytoene dehydrogenase-like protein